MQPLTKHREVTSGGITVSTDFDISERPEDRAFLKSILREGIYSDKVLAPLREYSANAWDANRMAGKPDVPIKVQLPTHLNPNLIIEDYGPGLSHEEVFGTFNTYCRSTKRGTDNAVGMLGIGSKSGFAYSDTFTVISRHGGKKRTYVAFLDESENDAFSLLSEEDWDGPTGLTIQIAARQEDIWEFQRKAKALFQHFQPRPNINLELPPVPEIQAKLTHGVIYNKSQDSYEQGQWFALMGCVPYKVDIDQLKGPNGDSLISESFKKNSGLLHFSIGQVQINASREELKYSKITKEALVAKFEALHEEFTVTLLEEIEKGDGTSWEKRCKAQTLLGLGLGEAELGDMATETIRLRGEAVPPSLDMPRNIAVSPHVQFVRNNGTKTFSGYAFDRSRHLLVEPKTMLDKDGKELGPYPWDVVNADLEKLIQGQKMDGIPIVDLDTLPWNEPWNERRAREKEERDKEKKLARIARYKNRPVNIKHKVWSFQLTKVSGGDKLSDRWDIVDRVPTEQDVFVTIEGFKTKDFNVYADRENDDMIAQVFGLTLPDLYGYKPSKSKKPNLIMGVEYRAWRKEWLANLPKDKLQELLTYKAWYNVIPYEDYRMNKLSDGHLRRVQHSLGGSHPLVSFLTMALKHTKYGPLEVYDLLEELGIITVNEIADTIRKQLRALYQTYPLLGSHGFPMLWNGNSPEWQRYVKLVDAEQTLNTVVPFTIED